MKKRPDGWYWIKHWGTWQVAYWEGNRGLSGMFDVSNSEPYVHETYVTVGDPVKRDPTPRRTAACKIACKGISTGRLEKMVPGTLANLLTLKGEK